MRQFDFLLCSKKKVGHRGDRGMVVTNVVCVGGIARRILVNAVKI